MTIPPPPPPAEGILFVCTTCPRAGEAQSNPVAAGSGRELADRLEEQLAGSKMQLVRVDCLSRCGRACNVRISARRTAGLEFHSLRPNHAPDLARLLESYQASPSGVVAEADIPPALAPLRP